MGVTTERTRSERVVHDAPAVGQGRRRGAAHDPDGGGNAPHHGQRRREVPRGGRLSRHQPGIRQRPHSRGIQVGREEARAALYAEARQRVAVRARRARSRVAFLRRVPDRRRRCRRLLSARRRARGAKQSQRRPVRRGHQSADGMAAAWGSRFPRRGGRTCRRSAGCRSCDGSRQCTRSRRCTRSRCRSRSAATATN